MEKNKVQIHDEESVQNVGPSKIKMVYQRFGDPDLPPVFLIMGAGAQMINWPEGFCIELASRGLHLIRFDNRDAGRSTHFLMLLFLIFLGYNLVIFYSGLYFI